MSVIEIEGELHFCLSSSVTEKLFKVNISLNLASNFRWSRVVPC